MDRQPRPRRVPRGPRRSRSACAHARQAGAIPDVLLLLEHPPVYTRGRRSRAGRAADGRGLVPRAGHRRRRRRPRRQASPTTARASSSATRSCASTTSSPTCARWSARSSPRSPTRASRRARRPTTAPTSPASGSSERKIASIGVHVSRGVTTHGFAVNVDNDLQPFEWIVPCGLPGVRMTSVAASATGARRHLPASASAWRSRSPGARPPPAADVARAPRGRARRHRRPGLSAAQPEQDSVRRRARYWRIAGVARSPWVWRRRRATRSRWYGELRPRCGRSRRGP